MTVQTKVIGRMPTYHGDYDPHVAYGKKYQVTLYGCVWESKHDNNNTAPATWDGGKTITPNTTDWLQISGSYEAWLMDQDRPANSQDYPFNNMGYVVLPMNIQDVSGTDKNLLTQDMFYKGEVGSRVPNSDTIFEIRYDFELAENITIPSGCVLKFEGGCISNASGNGYTLNGNNTVLAGDVCIHDSVSFGGSFYNDTIYADWFKTDGTDESTIINKAIELSKLAGKIVKMSARTYNISNPILMTRYLTLSGANRNVRHRTGSSLTGTIIQVNSAVDGIMLSANNGYIYKTIIENITLVGYEKNAVGIHFIPSETAGSFTGNKFYNLFITNFEHGIKLDSVGYSGIAANVFELVNCNKNKVGFTIYSTPLEGEETRAAWVNANMWLNCRFSGNTIGGIYFKGMNSYQNNNFIDSVIEQNGEDYSPDDINLLDKIGFGFYGYASNLSGCVNFERCYFENNYAWREGEPTANEFIYGTKTFPNDIEETNATIHIKTCGVSVSNCHIGRTIRFAIARGVFKLKMHQNNYMTDRFCPYTSEENCGIDHFVYVPEITTTRSTVIYVNEYWNNSDNNFSMNSLVDFIKFAEYAFNKRLVNIYINTPINESPISLQNNRQIYTRHLGGPNATEAGTFNWGLNKSFTINNINDLANSLRANNADVAKVRIYGNTVLDNNNGTYKITIPIHFKGNTSDCGFVTDSNAKNFYNDVTFENLTLSDYYTLEGDNPSTVIGSSDDLLGIRGGKRFIFLNCTIKLSSIDKSIINGGLPCSVEFYNCTFELLNTPASLPATLYTTLSTNVNAVYYNCTFPNNVNAINTVHQGKTSDRPVLKTDYFKGYEYFDTTLGKPIYWNGTAWVDATGATV